MESESEHGIGEVKTEIGIIVEALSVLQDFVESIFGVKYQNFVNSNHIGIPGGNGGGGGGNSWMNGRSAKDIQSELRRLRKKHSNSEDKCSSSTVALVSTNSSTRTSSEGKEDGGLSGSSSVTPTSLEKEGRRDSSSSQNNQFFNVTAERRSTLGSESREESESSYRYSLSVGKSELVSVKCEVDDTDFLDDMDPFGSECGDYQYEVEESDIKIEDCYPLQSSNLSNEDNQTNIDGNSKSEGMPNPAVSTSSSRFIPELIPIQADPVLLNAKPTNPLSTQVNKNHDDSNTSSSDNSDTDWKPSSTLTKVSSKKPKNDNKRTTPAKTKRVNAQPNHSSATNFVPTHYKPTPTPIRHLPTMLISGGGGPFKCDMCPASYKQEESLRSHQKYKHNPSRVQCTCHLCGKSMVDKYRLQRHLRLHTGEKPFECEYCGQSFYRKDYHTKHLQRKHGILYNPSAGAPSKVVRKPVLKPKPEPASSPSTSFTISPNSSASSSSYQSLRSSVFETPSPPLTSASFVRKTVPIVSLGVQRSNFISTTTSPSSSSLSPPATTTSPVISSPQEWTMKQQSSFGDIFYNNHSTTGPGGQSVGGGGVISAPEGSEYCAGGGLGGINNLMTMASLTFDDLISADL